MVVLSSPSESNVTRDLECSGIRLNNQRQKLRQRFDVIRKLGQGTYGKVQLALNKDSGQEVAIKTIKKAKIETEQDLIRIQREIQIMSSVKHPHIIHIYEVFENKEKIVLVMEYAAGGELYEYVSTQKSLAESEARRIFRQVVSAIYYCHKNNICHRDLKLENILLDENGNAKIADFGLSNVFEENRFLETFCGSPLYASPEIVKGTPYNGPEVDCWSLGVLLYTLVYGAMPFDGSNFQRLVKQISEGDYFEPKIPSEASGLIRRLLSVSSSERATVDDICDDWWVNKDCGDSLHTIAEDLGNETPVRLDYLLQLVPPGLPKPANGCEAKLVTETDETEALNKYLENNTAGIIEDEGSGKHQLSASEGSLSIGVKKRHKNDVEISELSNTLIEDTDLANESNSSLENIQMKSTTAPSFMNDGKPEDNTHSPPVARKDSSQTETSSGENTPEIPNKNKISFRYKTPASVLKSNSQNPDSEDSLSLNVMTTSSEQSIKSLESALTGAESGDMTWGSVASVGVEKMSSTDTFNDDTAKEDKEPENSTSSKPNQVAENPTTPKPDQVPENPTSPKPDQVPENPTSPKPDPVPENPTSTKPDQVTTDPEKINNAEFSVSKKPDEECAVSKQNPTTEKEKEIKSESVSEKGCKTFRSYEREFSSSTDGNQYLREVKKDTKEVSHQGYRMHRSRYCKFEKSVIVERGEHLRDIPLRRSDSLGSTGSNEDLEEIFDTLTAENSWLSGMMARTKAIIEEFSHTHKRSDFFKPSTRIGKLRSQDIFSKIDAAIKTINSSASPSSGIGSSWSEEDGRDADLPDADSRTSRHSARAKSSDKNYYFSDYSPKSSYYSKKMTSIDRSSSVSEETSSYRASSITEDKSEFSLKKQSTSTSQSSISSKYRREDVNAKDETYSPKLSQKSWSFDRDNRENHTSAPSDFRYSSSKESYKDADESFSFTDVKKPKGLFTYNKSRTDELPLDRNTKVDYDSIMEGFTARRPRSLSLLNDDDNASNVLANKFFEEKERETGSAASYWAKRYGTSSRVRSSSGQQSKTTEKEKEEMSTRKRSPEFKSSKHEFDSDGAGFEFARSKEKNLDDLETNFASRFRLKKDEVTERREVGSMMKAMQKIQDDFFKKDEDFTKRNEKSFSKDEYKFDDDDDLDESVSERIKRKSYLLKFQDLDKKNRDSFGIGTNSLLSRNKSSEKLELSSKHSSRMSSQLGASNTSVRRDHMVNRATSTFDEDQRRLKTASSKRSFSFK